MRFIWLCIIDGCLIRSGPVQPGDVMPKLMERMLQVFPHMSPDSLKVICEDGRIFDNELWFPNPTPADVDLKHDDLLAAVGVVEGHVGVKVHRGLTPEEILNAEASTFTGRIDDNVDFGIFDFQGEQLASIEDMIAVIGPENVDVPVVASSSEASSGKRRKGRRGFQRRRRPSKGARKPNESAGSEGTPPSSEASGGDANGSAPSSSERSAPSSSESDSSEARPKT